MRKLIFALTLVSFFGTSKAQDRPKRFELGSTLATITIYDFRYSSPSYEFINGLFFRYSRNRFALRALASYSDKTTTHTFAAFESPYFYGGSANNKDFKFGIGTQLSIFKSSDWLYTFVDFAYHNTVSTGYRFGYLNETFSSTANGLDCFFGVGAKFKMIKNIYLSPEIGFCGSGQFVKRTTISADAYNLTTGRPEAYKDSYTRSAINPIFKLHLSVQL
jgi:hypothetical protein